MICDMCGTEGKLFRTVVEGAELNVCGKCSKFGKVINLVRESLPQAEKPKLQAPKQTSEEIIELVVDDYSEKIRKGRENIGLKQEEFAKKINEKESLVQKMESGNFKPPLEMALKIEKFLKIRLIEEYKDQNENSSKPKSDVLTIGDIIKINPRQKL